MSSFPNPKFPIDQIPKETFERQKIPSLAGVGGEVWRADFDPEKPLPKERNLWERYQGALSGLFFSHAGQDPDMPSATGFTYGNNPSGWREMFSSQMPLKPDLYRDPYMRTKPCPEKYENLAWRICRYQRLNPKIPPPVDGKFNDIYHWLAYKHWYKTEREVYIAHTHHLCDAVMRCNLREGLNTAKNCRGLFNKYWAMTRMEEQNINLLYMSVTGNNAIRETPYPEDFVEQKRKIYDDWLFRSRMKKPGDPL